MNTQTALAANSPCAPSNPLADGPSMDRMVAWLHEPARHLHGMIQDIPGFAALRHVSLSVYDSQYDMLWAFACNSNETGAPEVTEVNMSDAPSLVLLADGQEPRIIPDLTAFGDEGRCHTDGARNSGSRSCMTVPIAMDGLFLGFVNFGATVPGFFGAPVQETLLTFTEAFGILIERARQLSD